MDLLIGDLPPIFSSWRPQLLWPPSRVALPREIADDAELAQRYARMSVQAFEQLGDTDGSARSLTTLALILGRSGQHAEGIGMHARAAAIRAQSGDLTGLARSLENIAWSRTSLGDFPVAAWLLGYAETLREESGVGHSSDDRLEYDEAVTHLATVLEPDELESLISAGRREGCPGSPELG